FRGHTDDVAALAFSQDGRHLVSGGKDGTIKVWDLTRGHEVRVLTPLSRISGGLAFSPNRPWLAAAANRSSDSDDTEEGVVVLDTIRGREVLRVPGCNDVVFDPGGRWLATGTPEGAIALWDAATGREIRRLRGRGHLGHRLAVSADGGRLASAGLDGSVQIWDPASGKLIRSWRERDGRVEGVSLSPDGTLLATAGEGGGRLWDAATGT